MERLITDNMTARDLMESVIGMKKVDVEIKNVDDEVLFKSSVAVPKTWSDNAAKTLARWYLIESEASAIEASYRIGGEFARWGLEDGYFQTKEEADNFKEEYTAALLLQLLSPNSPVWFNVGTCEKPRTSACYILSIDDTMESILENVKTEGLIFKYGSGTGTNFSTLRSNKEKLSNGGTPSGPLSFMKGNDAFADIIKSGGKTRRAARMCILNADHPDIGDFIESKRKEEKKIRRLIKAGFSSSFNDENSAYSMVDYQTQNNSVSIPDSFMDAVLSKSKWETKSITTREVIEELDANNLLDDIADAIWECGDPGIQFSDTMNKWNTCLATGKINGTNPCSEYAGLNNTSCNLASINLQKFFTIDGSKNHGFFDAKLFEHCVKLCMIAQNIVISRSSYPTDEITKMTNYVRTVGLGWANGGALLMSLGIPYNSKEGRGLLSSLTSLMTAIAWNVSSDLSKISVPEALLDKTPIKESDRIPIDLLSGSNEELDIGKVNRRALKKTIQMHKDLHTELQNDFEASWKSNLYDTLYKSTVVILKSAEKNWESLMRKKRFSNTQVSLMAPTGTIGLLMDCESTGIEPPPGLRIPKKLTGGGTMMLSTANSMISGLISPAVFNGDKEKAELVVKHLKDKDTLKGAPNLPKSKLKIFESALIPADNVVSPKGHVDMLADIQRFLSGSISKTINMPNSATREDIREMIMRSWKKGVKAVAIYRDGSKASQPLDTSDGVEEYKSPEQISRDKRALLPNDREGTIHKFKIIGPHGSHSGFIMLGFYPKTKDIGEIFIDMGAEGSTVGGLLDVIGEISSKAIQFGVPIDVIAESMMYHKFEPNGRTKNEDIPLCSSPTDYIGKFIKHHISKSSEIKQPPEGETQNYEDIYKEKADKYKPGGPPCSLCGAETFINGFMCYKCVNCGETSGCG